MWRNIFRILKFLFFLYPVIFSASVLDRTTSRYNADQGEIMSYKLYNKCLQEDSSACIGYKLFNAATSYIQNKTEVNSQWGRNSESESKEIEMDNQVNNVLFKKFLNYVDSWWPSADKDDAPRRLPSDVKGTKMSKENDRKTKQTAGHMIFNKKMLLPLLMGVVLKFGSLIPIVLSKLAFIGGLAIMASKMSLLIMIVMGLRKLFSGSDGGVSQMANLQPTAHHMQDQQAYYGDMQGQAASMAMTVPHSHQRVSYIVRGRQLGGNEFWTSPENAERRQGSEVDSETKVGHRFGVPNTLQSKSTKWGEKNSQPGKESGVTDDTINASVRRYNDSRGRVFSTPETISPGLHAQTVENEPVTGGGVDYTHGGSVLGNASDLGRDLNDSSTNENATQPNNLSSETSKPTQRLRKRHQLVEEGATGYSAGRRRLDEEEGEHVDAWIIRSKMRRA